MKRYEVFAGGVRIGAMPAHEYATICKVVRSNPRLHAQQALVSMVSTVRTLGAIFAGVPPLVFWAAVAGLVLAPGESARLAVAVVRDPAAAVALLRPWVPSALTASAACVALDCGVVGWTDVFEREINDAVRRAMRVPYPVDIEVRPIADPASNATPPGDRP